MDCQSCRKLLLLRRASGAQWTSGLTPSSIVLEIGPVDGSQSFQSGQPPREVTFSRADPAGIGVAAKGGQ